MPQRRMRPKSRSNSATFRAATGSSVLVDEERQIRCSAAMGEFPFPERFLLDHISDPDRPIRPTTARIRVPQRSGAALGLVLPSSLWLLNTFDTDMRPRSL